MGRETKEVYGVHEMMGVQQEGVAQWKSKEEKSGLMKNP